MPHNKVDPNFTGIVGSLNAINFISNDGVPYFVFEIPKPTPTPPSNQKPVFYVDLNRRGAQSIVSIVVAAYSSREPLKVGLENSGKPMRVNWVQTAKAPPK
jgi:hypothetical protein